MFKRIAAIFLTATLAFSFASCSALEGLTGGEKKDSKTQAAVGETLTTYFMDFTVQSVTVVDEFAGITPTEGNQLLDIVIESKNVFEDEIPMLRLDYVVLWGEDDYAEPFEAVDDTMAPEETMVAAGENVEYHYIYEVPSDVSDFSLAYWEQFEYEDGSTEDGDIFTIDFTI